MKKSTVIFLLAIVVAACSPETAKDRASSAVSKAREKVADVFDAAVPLGPREDPALREKERFDERWRQLNSFQRAAQRIARTIQPKPEIKITFVTGTKESFKNVAPNTINLLPVNVPIKGDVSGPSVLRAQILLDQVHFSVGAIDGRWGKNSAISTWWYQRARGFEETGEVDEQTFRALATETGNPAALIDYTITAEDLKGPFVSIPEDVYEKAKLDCLCYESVLEKLSEKFHSTSELLEKLNPQVKFSNLKEGDRIVALNVRPLMTQDNPDIARIVVSISGNTFNGYDANQNLLFHGPTTVGSKYDPSPDETVEVRDIIWDPHFHYQPTLFHEVPDSDPEAMLQPGPNSPVGVVWMALSKPHFGIHGTADPDSIGYASSHGCIRLANWDATEVGHRIRKGVPVVFVDTRKASGD